MQVKIESDFQSQLRAIAGRMGRHGQKIRKGAKDAVVAATEDLYEEAQKRAPALTGALEETGMAIKIESKGVDTIGYVHLTEEEEAEASDYVLYMHEGDYDLGPVSKIKQSGQAEVVGPKFLERAYDEGVDQRWEIIIRILSRALDSKMG